MSTKEYQQVEVPMSAIKYQKVPTNTSKYQIYHSNNIHLSYLSFKSCFFRKSPKVSKSHQNIKKVSESSKMYLISRSSTESLFSLVFGNFVFLKLKFFI